MQILEFFFYTLLICIYIVKVNDVLWKINLLCYFLIHCDQNLKFIETVTCSTCSNIKLETNIFQDFNCHRNAAEEIGKLLKKDSRRCLFSRQRAQKLAVELNQRDLD